MIKLKNIFKLSQLYPDITILLDNGHGSNTFGKRSPKWEDGTQLFEYVFNRNIVERIAVLLKAAGIKYEIIVPEKTDISLATRCKRVNDLYTKLKGKCFLISVHGNAGKGTGFEVWTSIGRTKSDDIATIMWQEMKTEFPNDKMRMDTTDGDVDKEKDYTILKKTSCPAILTENFFMDTEKDCRLMMSEEGRQKIANAHVRAIQRVIEELY